MENTEFKSLALSTPLLKALSAMGFEEATPIQALSIPLVLSGRDVIGQAQTGTGKTCAFGIPAVEMVDTRASGVQVMVLCPTRELAIQVSEEIRNLCRYRRGVKSLAIYGGQSIDRQIISLKSRPQIVIGTPGRIMDHMRRHTLKLQNLKMLVLDEADEMLNMGFRPDIDTILAELPEDRQTMLFSATMPRAILEIAQTYMREPEQVVTTRKEITIDTIDQYFIEVREHNKMELLCRLMDAKDFKLAIAFCNTKWKTDQLCSGMQARGYRAEALHGDMKQAERDRVMNKLRKGQVELLVATDVAARGIDVSQVEAVFNYDIPNDPEYYVHRIGRTGRAGRTGVSYSFAFGRELYRLREIQRYTRSRIRQIQPPTASTIQALRLKSATQALVRELSDPSYKKYVEILENLLEDLLYTDTGTGTDTGTDTDTGTGTDTAKYHDTGSGKDCSNRNNAGTSKANADCGTSFDTDYSNGLDLSQITSLDLAAALFKMHFPDLEKPVAENSELDRDFALNNRENKFQRLFGNNSSHRFGSSNGGRGSNRGGRSNNGRSGSTRSRGASNSGRDGRGASVTSRNISRSDRDHSRNSHSRLSNRKGNNRGNKSHIHK